MPSTPPSPFSPPSPLARGLPVQARRGHAGAEPAPFQQGQLDGLCGLDAIVQALSLLFSRSAPLTYGECYELFALGLDTIAPPGELAATVAEGVDVRLWRRTVTLLANHAARARGYQVRVARPFRGLVPVRLAEFHRIIQAALDRDAVVVAMLCGTHHHFTVISGHDARRYLLFDSAGLRWLAKSACGLEGSDARHRVAIATLMIVEATT